MTRLRIPAIWGLGIEECAVAEGPRKALDRLANHTDLVKHGRSRFLIRDESLERVTLNEFGYPLGSHVDIQKCSLIIQHKLIPQC